MSTKAASQALYAELDQLLPGWRKTYSNIDQGVEAAGDRAAALHADWQAAFAERSQQAPKLKKVDEDSPFEHSRFGGRVSGERWDEPGNEDLALSYAEEGTVERHFALKKPGSQPRSRTPSGEYHGSPGHAEDSLFHLDDTTAKGRLAAIFPWTGTSYTWAHRPPRENSCIRCF